MRISPALLGSDKIWTLVKRTSMPSYDSPERPQPKPMAPVVTAIGWTVWFVESTVTTEVADMASCVRFPNAPTGALI
jgi:hypothetical protein